MQWDKLLHPPATRPIIEYRYKNIKNSDIFLNSLYRAVLPSFDINETYDIGPSIFAVPRMQSTPNTGRFIAFMDPESDLLFDILKVEQQDNENRVWIGIKLQIENGSRYYVSEEPITLEVPMSMCILNNVQIKRDGALSKRSANSISQIISELDKHGNTDQVCILQLCAVNES